MTSTDRRRATSPRGMRPAKRPRRSPPSTRRRAARTTSAATPPRRRGLPARRRPTNRRASSFAPRSAPRRATAASTSSCRRPRRSRTTSRSSPRSRRRREAMRLPVDPRRLRAAEGSAPGAAARHARPGRDRGQRPSGVELERAGRADHASLRGGARDAPDDREVHARRPPHRHRRRQPLRPRRRDAGRLAVPAPARPARQHDRLLAQPSGAELPVLGHVRRPDQPGAAHRRGAQRFGLRDRDRVRRARARRRGRGRQDAAVADRPPAAQPADRRHRQHPPRRVLHRQALLARRPDRPPRPARDARLRDAAACAHEPGPAAADARARRPLLGRAVPAGAARALGHRAARPLHAAALHLGRTSATSSAS